MPRSPDPSGPVTDELLRRGRVARIAWLSLGLVLVGIGFVGIFVPLLPTTDFLILAVPCFARSSPRLERWLLEHPRFGPAIRAWREGGVIPRHAKIAACVGMSVGYAIFWFVVRPKLLLATLVAVPLISAAAWIIRRPGRES